MGADWVEGLIATLEPEPFAETVRRLAAAQSEGNRTSVSVAAIMDALTGGKDLGSGPLGWHRYLRLKLAISDLAGRAAGLRYVEGDA